MSGIPWPRGNPESQGYSLTDKQLHELRFGIRFPTGLCLPLVVTGFVLESPAILISLAAVGAIAGFGPRHPFDLVWNHGVRLPSAALAWWERHTAGKVPATSEEALTT